MNELQIFNNPEFGEIRAVEIDGAPWFVLKDICRTLEMDVTQLKKIADRLDEDGKGRMQITTPGGPQETWIVNESGLYDVIIRSDKPKAKPLRKWVTSEVLPSIRRTGGYLSPELAKAMADLPAMMELMEGMEKRLSALERRGTALPAQLEALPLGAEPQAQVPGAAFRKRWMRTVSEKLNLLQVRFDMTHNELLHQLYKILEKENDVVLEEEKLRTMEEYGLEECSVLTAIFYNPALRDNLQGTIDYNLAPENRGW